MANGNDIYSNRAMIKEFNFTNIHLRIITFNSDGKIYFDKGWTTDIATGSSQSNQTGSCVPYKIYALNNS